MCDMGPTLVMNVIREALDSVGRSGYNQPNVRGALAELLEGDSIVTILTDECSGRVHAQALGGKYHGAKVEAGTFSRFYLQEIYLFVTESARAMPEYLDIAHRWYSRIEH